MKRLDVVQGGKRTHCCIFRTIPNSIRLIGCFGPVGVFATGLLLRFELCETFAQAGQELLRRLGIRQRLFDAANLLFGVKYVPCHCYPFGGGGVIAPTGPLLIIPAPPVPMGIGPAGGGGGGVSCGSVLFSPGM